MAANEKILKAMKSAMAYLEKSMLALNKKDENSLADDIWHVATELEYALFLFSMILQDESRRSKWKLNAKLKKAEVGSMLTGVRDLLDEAENCMADEKLLSAYKNAYISRHYILKIQEDFAKKKREALKKK